MTITTPPFTASDFDVPDVGASGWTMVSDDNVHPDVQVGESLERLDEPAPHPLRARVDALESSS